VSRLIVVSNRLPGPPATGPHLVARETTVGGLAAAILGALRGRGDSLWVGWNGRASASARSAPLQHHRREGVDLASFPLTTAELDGYYHGFCNQTLWPILHCFQGRVRTRLRDQATYDSVQARFADHLLPVLRRDDRLWVHDYHLIPLGQRLRERGWRGRMGFFLHTPFPPLEMWEVLPRPRALLEALFEYDVVGFHVPGFLDNYVYCARRLLGADWDGRRLAQAGRSQRAAVYPVGIDPAAWRPKPGRVAADDGGEDGGESHAARVGEASLANIRLLRGLQDRRMILGVDRLDYTKGIPQRLQAIERFFRRRPEWRRRAVYVQVASPSRAQVPEYAEQRRRIEATLGRVNGELGEPDWTPIRYLYRAYDRPLLARLYREADVGLVTPLRDGMNLVAKEYVAAQDPADPGVLILSHTAGAAQQLKDAVLVNAFVPADVAEGIAAALEMPLAERQRRHARLLQTVLESTAEAWADGFVQDLEGEGGGAGDRSRRPLHLAGPKLGPVAPSL
jgi:alpha,alpha-trehalose-phosphate synthase [UDP-forming]